MDGIDGRNHRQSVILTDIGDRGIFGFTAIRGETEDDNLLKDQDMITRLKEVKGFSEQEKNQIFFTLDAVIREIKNRRTYSIAK